MAGDDAQGFTSVVTTRDFEAAVDEMAERIFHQTMAHLRKVGAEYDMRDVAVRSRQCAEILCGDSDDDDDGEATT